VFIVCNCALVVRYLPGVPIEVPAPLPRFDLTRFGDGFELAANTGYLLFPVPYGCSGANLVGMCEICTTTLAQGFGYVGVTSGMLQGEFGWTGNPLPYVSLEVADARCVLTVFCESGHTKCAALRGLKPWLARRMFVHAYLSQVAHGNACQNVPIW
jgi:hypothetical protein